MFYNSYFICCATSTCFILVQFIMYYMTAYISYVSKCKWYIYKNINNVNKHIELAQRGIVL